MHSLHTRPDTLAMGLARDAGAKSSDSEKANGLQDAYVHEGMRSE